MKRFLQKLLLLIFLSFGLITISYANVGFVVQNIRFVGLQRISEGTAFSYLPVKSGEYLDTKKSNEIINSLYATGFFQNIVLAQAGNTLVIEVSERPTIGLINITGNKIIKTKQLKSVLKQAGIEEGLVFNAANLDNIEQALLEQYYNLGRYNATVTVNLTPEVRNRVGVDIRIYEGQIAKIRQIKIIGNRVFSEKILLKQFKLGTPNLFSFFTHNDQYSQVKLDSDLERLRSYYLDRGYIQFKITSTQVAITPDRRHVYMTINVKEGPQYHVSGFGFSGKTQGQEAKLKQLVGFKAGDVFSRAKVIAADKAMTEAFANRGYAFANINIEPKIDQKTHSVYLDFDIQPGKKVYINQISFIGNSRTADFVLRREMRLMEGSLFSLSKIQESKRRINNLGYLSNVEIATKPVANHPNEVDLDYHVKETSSASASVQAGFSDTYGFLYGANINERNFRGTGRDVGLSFSHNEYIRNYNFNYYNPYFTQSGISQGFNIYANKVTPGSIDLSSYTTNSYGFNVYYGFPMSEYDTINLGYGYENIRVDQGSSNAAEITNFLAENGHQFNVVTANGGWQHSSYDRAIFPRRGFMQSIGVILGIPALHSSLDYYKLNYQAGFYHPLFWGMITHLRLQLGYGNGYGKTSNLPFFYNYYAGGIDSVRGYGGNSLGPKDNNGDAIGGNVLTDGGVGLIIPNPIEDKVRTSIFVDGGNVYEDQLKLNKLRYSVGIGADWWSPIGPLQFSLAYGVNPGPGDSRRPFQFNIGTSF